MWKLELGGVRFWVVLLMGLVAVVAFAVAMQRIRVEGDVFAAIPESSPVLASSRRLLRDNSLTERVAVDVSLESGRSPAELFRAADEVAGAMRASGLFATVGIDSAAEGVMELNLLLAEHLPLLFSTAELEGELARALQPAAVRSSLEARIQELSALEGTGASELIRRDPLNLRFLALGRLRALSVGFQGKIEQGHLVSPDGRHVLVTAIPLRPLADGEHNQKLAAFFTDLGARMGAPSPPRPAVHLEVVGGFRAALDNEAIVRADTERAIVIATLGIALLLVLFFARPVLGVLSLLPATTGVSLGLLGLSFIDRDVSALALGFGGALVSITVDQGIMFASFLDRFRDRPGLAVAKAIFPPGLLATITTAGAFLALRFSGFELLSELGTFAALSAIASFLVVQLVFPHAFRPLPAVARRPLVPLDGVLGAITIGRGFRVAAVAAVFAVALVAWRRPGFEVDLAAMSTVTAPTEAAEAHVRDAWGDVLSNAYVYFDAANVAELRSESDALAELCTREAREGRLGAWFSPSLVAPGRALAAEHARAWAAHFTPARRARLEREVREASEELGFSAEAFAPFLASLHAAPAREMPLPEQLMPLVGISRRADGRLGLLMPVERGPAWDAAHFSHALAEIGGSVHDGRYLASVLGDFLRSAFLRMVAIIGGLVFLFVIVTFLDPLLVATVMAPVLFGLAVTLGGLGALGRPLDIAGLLLAIIVFGMGINFSFHLVKSHQRWPRDDDPEHAPVRAATFLECTATAIGMASLACAEHATARSAGIVGLLGITTSGVGAFVFLPPLLRRLFRSLAPDWAAAPGAPARAVFRRYRYLPAGPRTFAWGKLRFDPMFARLREALGARRRVLDVGAGFGVPATFLLAAADGVTVVATEPDPERAWVARLAVGARGEVHELAAPELPADAAGFELALLLDVAHYLDDEALAATLRGIRERLAPGGVLLMRETVPGPARASLLRRIEAFRLRRRGLTPRFRSVAELRRRFDEAGLTAEVELVPDREEAWLTARSATELKP